MPIIQDPRMNPKREETYGILYNSPADSEYNGYDPGHYFYDKIDGNQDERNSRYFPHGFPVEIVRMRNQDLQDLADLYSAQFCNIVGDRVAVIVRADSEKLADKPMAMYMYKAITQGTKSPPAGRGLT